MIKPGRVERKEDAIAAARDTFTGERSFGNKVPFYELTLNHLEASATIKGRRAERPTIRDADVRSFVESGIDEEDSRRREPFSPLMVIQWSMTLTYPNLSEPRRG